MPSPSKFIAGSGILSFGDSFTVGSNATSNYGYAQMLAAYVGGPASNYGAGSSLTTYSTAKGFAYLPVGYRRQLVTYMAGLNNIRGGGAAAIPCIEGDLRAFIAASLLATAVPASSLPKTGSWSALASDWGGKSYALGGTAMFTSDINATMRYNFYGDNMVVGAYRTSGVGHYQDFEIEIDGGAPILFSLLGLTNKTATYDAKVISGLGVGRHTAIFRPINSIPHTVIDYVGTLVAPGSQAPVLIGKIPYLLNWAQYNSIATQAIADDANAVIESVAAEFSGYDVQVVEVNDFYDYSTNCSSDGIHPTSAGHTQISNAFKDRIVL